MRIALFASGNGSNFEAIVQANQQGRLHHAKICLLFCDRKNAGVHERAKRLGIKVVCFSPKEFPSKEEYEQMILNHLAEESVEFIVLAGYMRMIGETLLDVYEGKMINIHPSLLPAFPGLHGIDDAFAAGVSETGVTIHYIDRGMDTGPIIRQESVPIYKHDTLATLEERIHALEHQMYPQVLQTIIDQREDLA
ncbi:MAG: phosphoribosylglycinamide formyltransferase [Enterococcus sp.]